MNENPKRKFSPYHPSFRKLVKPSKAEREEAALRELTDVSIAQIEEALRKHYGNLTFTAEFLKMDRDVLERRIKTLPHMKRLLVRIREEFIDLAEKELANQVKKGYFPAISLVLKTLGKERGYTERGELEMGVSTQSAAALIEAMRKGIAAPETVDIEDYEWKPVESESEKVS